MFADLPVTTTFALFVPLIVLEMAGPFIAESKATTPWHPHHIAERYGLLVIITLGEVILGTVAALNVLVHGEAGWTVDAALLAIAGVGLTFGCWWMYFAVPWAEPLVRRPGRFSGFVFGYGHLAIFAPAGRDGRRRARRRVRLAGEAKIGATGTVLSVVIPFAVFALAFYVVYSLLVHSNDPFHLWLLAATGAVLAARGRAGGGGRERAGLPARRHARAGGDRHRLRDDRAPPHIRRDGAPLDGAREDPPQRLEILVARAR